MKLRKKDLYDGDYPSHCGECGERFIGQDRAEVVRTVADEMKGQFVGDVVVVHAETCFDPETMEIA